MTCDLGLGDDEAGDGDDSDVKDNNGKEGWLRSVSHSQLLLGFLIVQTAL